MPLRKKKSPAKQSRVTTARKTSALQKKKASPKSKAKPVKKTAAKTLKKKTSTKPLASKKRKVSSRKAPVSNAQAQLIPFDLSQHKKRDLDSKSTTNPFEGSTLIDSQLATDLLAEALGSSDLPIQPPPMAQSGESTVIEKVDAAVTDLGKLESDIMIALFPTDGSSPKSYEEIAKDLGMDLSEVKAVADTALRDLRGGKLARTRISSIWN